MLAVRRVDDTRQRVQLLPDARHQRRYLALSLLKIT